MKEAENGKEAVANGNANEENEEQGADNEVAVKKEDCGEEEEEEEEESDDEEEDENEDAESEAPRAAAQHGTTERQETYEVNLEVSFGPYSSSRRWNF